MATTPPEPPESQESEEFQEFQESEEFQESPASSGPSNEPSNDELLRAVERYLAARGRDVRLYVPGTARLTRDTLLDFRIVRQIEVRGRPQKKKEPDARRSGFPGSPPTPTSTPLSSPVPVGFGSTPPLGFVLADSIKDVPCPGCEEGERDCPVCRASGKQACPKREKCTGCGGGANACRSCGGTRRKGSRKPPPKPPGKPRTACCRLGGAHDLACSECFGERTKVCGPCNGTGQRVCDECGGRKRVGHEDCRGEG